jgi:MFS family permease
LLSRSLVLLALGYAAVGYFQYLFFYWIEYYFKDVMRLSIAQSRNNTTLLVLALGVGMPVGGWLADWTQRRHPGRLGWVLVPGVAMALSAGFLFLGVAAREAFWIVTLFGLAMFALGASESTFWQVAVKLGGSRGGTAAAIINTGGNGVGLLAPLLTPVISAALGWQWGIAIGGIVGLLGALCWCGIDPTRQTSESQRNSLSNA